MDEHDTDRQSTRRSVLAGAAGLTAWGSLASTSAAGGVAPTDSELTTSREQLETVDDEHEGLVSLVEDRLAEAGVPGAAVAVVVDGQVVLAGGYGEAEPGRPADATTPFRIASVSKPVVGTAAAELAARGDLDFETPVSEYLQERLVSWEAPVTLRALLTHTAGFDPTNRNMWYPSPEQVRSLPEHLSPMPAQVREPGTLGAYSNHGFALAGQVIAAVTDSPFAAAMEELVFAPAGMSRASFAQPLPDELATDHAVNPGTLARLRVRDKLAGLGIGPAGALSATATDMARFLSLHLNGGMIDGEQIFHPAAIELAQRQWFTHHEAIDGMALGFVEDHHGPARVLTHDGFSPTDGFTSQLRLVPDHGIGVFTAFNGNGLEAGVANAVIEELLPEPSPESREPTRPQRADDLVGTYHTLRRGVRAPDSLWTNLGAASLSVSVADDGALVLDGANGPTRWTEVESLVFEREDGTERVAFGTDDAGAVTRLFVGGQPSAFTQTDWHESPVLLAGTLFGGVLGTWWGFKKSKPDRHREESRREWLAGAWSDFDRTATLLAHTGTGAISLFFLLLFGYVLVGNTQYVVGFLTEPATVFGLTYTLSVAGATATAGVVVVGAYAVATGRWSRHRRVAYAATALVLTLTTVLLWHWNLLLPAIE